MSDYPPGCPTASQIEAAYDVLRWVTFNYLLPNTDTWAGIVEGTRCLSICGAELWDLKLWEKD